MLRKRTGCTAKTSFVKKLAKVAAAFPESAVQNVVTRLQERCKLVFSYCSRECPAFLLHDLGRLVLSWLSEVDWPWV